MTAKIHWVDCRVYCYQCHRLTKLNPDKEGHVLCPFCKADLLAWFLKETGLARATNEAGSAKTAPMSTIPAQGGILLRKGEAEGKGE
jgi:hypothetical protein